MKNNFLYRIFFLLPFLLIIIFIAVYIPFMKMFLQNETANYLTSNKNTIIEQTGIENWNTILQVSKNITEAKTKIMILGTMFLFCTIIIIFLFVIFFIISINKKNNKRLENIIFKDSLTKFSNWDKFKFDAKCILQKYGVKSFAFINFDINKFKTINDIYGACEGDKILTYIAEVVDKEMNYPNEIFARSSADNFIMLIEFKSREEIIRRIKNIINQVNNFNHTILLSFGIYIIEDKLLDINLINDRAKIAKNKTKGRHDIFYSFYKDDIRHNIIKEKEIEDQMEDALKNNEFKVYMQPKFNVIQNKIVGAEALIRWERDEKIILPGEFMPVFEKNGFVTKIDDYVFEEVCRIIKDLIERNISPVTISVNIARFDMHDDSFINKLNEMINKYQIPIKYIEIEITESTVLNFDSIGLFLDVVNKIKSFGFTLSMDDFGSGYSSLNLLCDIPVDTLKLDKEFLNKNTNLERGEIIIADIISMAKHLNVNIVAEGVETQEQVDFLKSVGCEVIQGYYYSKPIPIKEFEKKLLADGGSGD